ncbi:MAG: tetratricopeptide (TPR) repeat protein [Verrucomicrobiales bacterium]|jgi:tetratricopeptide (TPR) repeat protein
MSNSTDPRIPPVTAAELSANHKAFYKKAVAAVGGRNADYAIQMLLPIIVTHPGFLEGRKLLRRAEAIKNGPPKKVTMKMLVGFKSKIQKDPIAAIRELEEKTFLSEPFHVEGAEMLYESALALKDMDLAAFALRTVIDGHKGHPKMMHKLGEHFTDIGRADQAVGVYQELVKLVPNDGAAGRGLTNAQAQATMNEKNWGTSGSAKELLKDQDETAALELDSRTGMTREQMEQMLSRWSAKYEENPNDLQVVRKVADICMKLEDFETAAQYFDWAATLNPADTALKQKAETARHKAVERRIIDLEKQIESAGNAPDIEEKKQQLDALRSSGAEDRIASAKKAVDTNPTDAGLRFALGSEFFRAGKFSEAIPELQKAKNNPGFRVRALSMLGKCYAEKKMYDLARNQFQDALKEMVGMDDAKKSLIYDLGVLCERMGDKEAALGFLKQIYEADYGYRDVAERVESAYADS